MIDAHAVLAQLDSLGDTSSATGSASLDERLQQMPGERHTDAEGNRWVTLPGKSERTLLLGCYAAESSAANQLPVVIAMEAFKALAHRFEGTLPCTLQLALWREHKDLASSGGSNAESVRPAAYLELQTAAAGLEQEALLGVVDASEQPGGFSMNPRLSELCNEAVIELTGKSAFVRSSPSLHAAKLAGSGVPVAAMYSRVTGGSSAGPLEGLARTHILETAEAFGRWAEAAVHLLAGDEVDLWAQEHRTPRT